MPASRQEGITNDQNRYARRPGRHPAAECLCAQHTACHSTGYHAIAYPDVHGTHGAAFTPIHRARASKPPASVTVVSFTPVDWRNGCLEVDRMERPCTDAIVPGYQVMLSVAGQNYEYRTNLDGSQVVFAGPDVVQSPSVPAAVVFTWHREGGIAGVCDELRVLATGEVVASNCRRGVSDEVGRSTLTPAEDDQLDAWLAAYAPINATFKDAAVADALTQTLALAGRGTTQPTADEEQAMLDLASTVYARIASDVLR